MRTSARRRALVTLTSAAPYRGPARREDPAGDTGDPNPGGGGAGDGQDGAKGDPEQPPAGQRVEDLPSWAQKIVQDARTGEAKARTQAKATAATEAAEQARQEMAQKIGKALGLVKDGDQEQADPAQLTQQLTKMADTNRSLTAELAVWKAAKKAGANAQALTDSRSFLDRLGNLDPTAADFDGRLRDAIKKAVDDNPQYREGQAPLRSGGEFTGGPGGADKEPATPAERLRRGYATKP